MFYPVNPKEPSKIAQWHYRTNFSSLIDADSRLWSPWEWRQVTQPINQLRWVIVRAKRTLARYLVPSKRGLLEYLHACPLSSLEVYGCFLSLRTIWPGTVGTWSVVRWPLDVVCLKMSTSCMCMYMYCAFMHVRWCAAWAGLACVAYRKWPYWFHGQLGGKPYWGACIMWSPIPYCMLSLTHAHCVLCTSLMCLYVHLYSCSGLTWSVLWSCLTRLQWNLDHFWPSGSPGEQNGR